MTIRYIVLIALVFFVLKNTNALIMRMKIIDAIYNYNIHCIENGCVYDHKGYDQMEHYMRTLFRFYDWGCSNIVPFEDYLEIVNFIK